MLEYKYSGGDSSPVYQYILSPFAQVLVDNMIPMWMAPNVVTLIGLCASVLSMIVTLLWNPQLNENGPHWLHLLNALCVFAYQTFDNMDGKQARRTGTSSPLGMLFDHGCDALNAGIICIPMASVAATGWTTKFYMCLWSGFLPFYFQAWEEYYTGSMVLPPFNGPTEGLLIAIGMCCLSYIFGAHYWHQSVFQLSPEWSVLGIPIVDGACDITPYFMAFSFTTTVSSIIALKQIYTVIVHVLRSGNSQQSVGKALLDLLPFLVFFPTILYWCAVSDIALSWYPLVTVNLLLLHSKIVSSAFMNFFLRWSSLFLSCLCLSVHGWFVLYMNRYLYVCMFGAIYQ